jgi:FlaA1/EpsC-like NDP-sugar epimerase
MGHTAAWAIIDGSIVLGSFGCAFWARALTAPLDFQESLGFLIFIAILTIVSFFMFGIYARIWSQTSGHEVSIILKALFVSAVVTGALDLAVGSPRPVPISVMVVGYALTAMGMVAVRYQSRLVSGLSWRWKAIWHHEFPTAPTRTLIVGAGESGQAFAWRLRHRWDRPSGQRFQTVGFVDDDPGKLGRYVEGRPVLGGRTDIPNLAQTHRVELIVLALDNASGSELRDVLSYCDKTDARIKVVPDTFSLLNSNGGLPLRDIQPEDIIGRKPVGRHNACDLSPIAGKTILVTGAAGSIGSETCRQLLNHDIKKLVLLDNNESGLHNILLELEARTHIPLEPVLVDITDVKALSRVFRRHRPEIVFHAAAYKHVPLLQSHPCEAIRVNVKGTWQLSEFALQSGVERFVLISSDKAVEPSSVMGASKRLCELLMAAMAGQSQGRTLFTSVRFGNVFGSRGSVVPTFLRQIESGGPVTVTHKDMARYFMTISEAVNLVIHASCLTEGNDQFLLNMGDEIKIVSLAERLIRMRGLRPYQDIDIQFTGLRPGEKLHERLWSDAEIPYPTAHPNIVKLVDPGQCVNKGALMDYLHVLFQQCKPGETLVDMPEISSSIGGSRESTKHPCLACMLSLMDEVQCDTTASTMKPRWSPACGDAIQELIQKRIEILHQEMQTDVSEGTNGYRAANPSIDALLGFGDRQVTESSQQGEGTG